MTHKCHHCRTCHTTYHNASAPFICLLCSATLKPGPANPEHAKIYLPTPRN